jgi:hypothetical protein
VGRISAHIDRRFNEHHGNAWGWFGFIEFEDDPEVVAGLLAAAREWLHLRGRDRMVGPADFAMNDECGILIEGFDRDPLIRQPWHPPSYAARLEEAGMAKEVDLLMWELTISDREKLLPILWDLAGRLEPEHDIVIRKMSRRRLRAELDLFAEIYNRAWRRNWGFVPTARGPRRARPGDAARLRPRLVHGGRGHVDRGGRRPGHHHAGHQPGPQRDGRAAAAAGLVALPAQGPDDGPGARGVPRRQAGVPARRRGRGLFVEHFNVAERTRTSGARWAGSWRRTRR